MSTEARRDLKYSGNVVAPGGHYKRVNLTGNINIDGDMDCHDIRIIGVFKDTGSLKSKTGSINGIAAINGDFASRDININGETRVDGNMSADKITLNGRIAVKGDVRSETINAIGELRIQGDYSSEAFDVQGVLNIEGALNAGDVNIQLYGPSATKEIGGEKIRVRKGGDTTLIKALATILNPLGFPKAHITVETIEGDDIELEHTKAKVVRGNTVTIGDGCEVDLVEYKDELKKSPGASVLKQVKI